MNCLEHSICISLPSGTIHASCFDEDPNGISILTKSDSKTCCKDENIIPDVNEEKSCEDMDNRRSVFTFSLLRPFEFLVENDAMVRRKGYIGEQ